ncbi:uncharacterized protein LOC127130836 [Lathyrus oleraceus]|uniref:uncharacterized protein LOC127130836 n=1 Tax=Pisum sativum TaxID=3888 RepID=UPI0021D1902D|nr:uncharacterized protein LOC127130836 [Pisum sativum]
MDHLEQDKHELKEDVARLTTLMESLIVAQSQAPPTPATPQQWIVISEIISTPVSVVPINHPTHFMLAGFSWGIPTNYVPEGYAPTIAPIPKSRPVMSTPSPVLHVMPRVDETTYHSEPSEGPDMYEKMDEMKDEFQEMKKEMKTLRGKDLFGKNSLTGSTLHWYMGIDSGNVCTFNDLGKVFAKQYKYNVDMVPDRDQLCYMPQKDNDTFKEYAQRWRELSAQTSPPLEETEMKKIFLKTLSSFYYEHMIASSINDFTEMVNMGMRLEEDAREDVCLEKKCLLERSIWVVSLRRRRKKPIQYPLEYKGDLI